MTNTTKKPRVIVIADVESNANQLVDRVLRPAGIEAWPARAEAPPADVLVVDVTLFRGDPLSGLRARRESGDNAPAVVLAAHFPASRLRGLFRLGVRDILLKPYRTQELLDAIQELHETRSGEGDSQRMAHNMEGMREDLRRRSEEIRMLSEIGRVVAGLDDLDQILTRLVEAAAYVSDAEEASIYLADPETNAVVLRANKQSGERYASLQRLRVDDTLVGQVFRSGQPVLLQSQSETGPLKVQTGFMVQSLVKVPVRMRQDVVGVLGVYNRLTLRSFNQHHVTLLQALADWAGLALERAALVQGAGEGEALDRESIYAAPKKLTDGLDVARTLLTTLSETVVGLPPEELRSQLSRVRRLIEQLRALPITTLDSEAAQSLVNLPQLTRRAAGELKLDATRRGLNLIVEAEARAPLFPGDSRRVYQVIQALAASAIRRTTAGRVMLQVQHFKVADGKTEGMLLPAEVRLAEGTWSGVAVVDSSPGLEAEVVRAITSEQVDPAAGNLGYGLSMGEIRMIVESMGGRLWHQATPANTKITFALPAA
jgi:FixJ family two-component response regulator